MEPRTVDTFARYAAQGANRRQLLRFALGSLGGLALGRRAAAAQEPCVDPFISCNEICIYPLADNENCGACGNACGDLVCIDGVCTSCEEFGLGTCFDPDEGVLFCADLTHYLNCGACGNVCTSGLCVDGECVSTVECDEGYSDCFGTCVDLQTDTWHCGSCTRECAGEAGPGESSVGICVEGECQVVCLEGYTWCDGAGCVDLNTNEANCGECGYWCDGLACVDGYCVATEPEPEPEEPVTPVTLPATGSGTTRPDPQDQLPLIGAAATLAALGLRHLGTHRAADEELPPTV